MKMRTGERGGVLWITRIVKSTCLFGEADPLYHTPSPARPNA